MYEAPQIFNVGTWGSFYQGVKGHEIEIENITGLLAFRTNFVIRTYWSLEKSKNYKN